MYSSGKSTFLLWENYMEFETYDKHAPPNNYLK